MGGNALTVPTRRYSAQEYGRIALDVVNKLAFKLGVKIDECDAIPAYHNKESFGDLDIIYSTRDDEPLSVAEVQQVFNAQQIIKNGSVVSFDYKEFQVDLIHSKKSCYDYGLSYYSYNDLGNIGCGKLVKHFGLKHGHDGLFLPLYDEFGNKFASILLTENHDDTLKLVGLDVNTFRKGFAELNDIFEYVASSPYYNPKYYLLENVNSAARMRDKKREVYREFLEFGKNWVGETIESHEDKSLYTESLLERFPNALEAYRSAIRDKCLDTVAKSKFNGDMVSALTGLQDKELGNLMQILKQDFRLKKEQVVLLPEQKIKSIILEKFELQ